MAQNRPSIPHLDFLDMRRASGTKISSGLCSCFLCVHNGTPPAQEIPTEPWSSRPLHLSYLLGGAFGTCFGGSDTPAVWDRSWTSRLELQSLRGILS